jgi:hypothetical protein
VNLGTFQINLSESEKWQIVSIDAKKSEKLRNAQINPGMMANIYQSATTRQPGKLATRPMDVLQIISRMTEETDPLIARSKPHKTPVRSSVYLVSQKPSMQPVSAVLGKTKTKSPVNARNPSRLSPQRF